MEWAFQTEGWYGRIEKVTRKRPPRRKNWLKVTLLDPNLIKGFPKGSSPGKKN